MKTNQLKGSAMLLLTAMIWGCAFVAQSVGMDYVGPFTFMCSRSILGGVVLLPVIFFSDRLKKKNGAGQKLDKKGRRNLITGGLVCGVLLCAASNFQQFGIQYTTVGKAGFITAMYILLVPVLGIFFKKKVPAKIWGCVALAVAGLYFLCMSGSFSVGKGDALCMVCALLFSLHILAVDYFVQRADGVKIACMQFFVTGIISGILMFIFETPSWGDILDAWMPVVYAGVLSSGVAYTFQILGQKYTPPTVASLLMSLESFFAAVAGAVILRQIPSGREIIGCVLMLAAIMLSQLPDRKKSTV